MRALIPDVKSGDFMKLAFCLFKYFPFGGLQRDFMRIATACRDRGHEVEVFVMKWEGEVPDNFKVNRVNVRALTNHGKCLAFAKTVQLEASQRFDAIVGFNKMPGLDLYFAADPCYLTRMKETRGPLSRLGGRFRTYVSLERAVFNLAGKTHILILSEEEKRRYMAAYGTPEERFHVLPPGIDRNRLAPKNASTIRRELREAFGIGDEYLVLMVGSGYRTKGLDRSLRAIAALPDALRCKTRLFVIGEGQARPFVKMAKRFGIEQQVSFLGGREDVPQFLLGADLLLHPSYTEAYGMVLLEAMAAGLPVLVTDICGYAYHIERANAGLLIPSPFKQETMNKMLVQALSSSDAKQWRQNGLTYVAKTDIFSLPEKAADLIENVACKGASHA